MSKYPIVESIKDLLKRMPFGVPMVAPVIPRTGGWTGDNQLGRMAPYGPDSRGRQTILKLDEWGPPEVWTVSLFLKQEFEDFNGFNVTAEIGFGVGGSTQIVQIDWVNGCQISAPMNALNVQAIFADIDIAAEGRGLSLGVQIARGARGGQDLPRLTMLGSFDLQPVGGTITVDIPAFAKSVVVLPASTAFAKVYSVDLNLALRTGNGAGSDVVSQTDGTHLIDGLFKLPVTGQARRARVTYTGAGAAPPITLYAEIDG